METSILAAIIAAGYIAQHLPEDEAIRKAVLMAHRIRTLTSIDFADRAPADGVGIAGAENGAAVSP